MGLFRTIILALAGAGALATSASAAGEDDWPTIKSARLNDQRPWGAFALYRAPDARATGVTLYLRGSMDDHEMIARRVEMDSGDHAVISWASSKTCANLISATVELEDLQVPRIEVPGAGREPRQAAVALDASSYFVWADDARFSGGGHSAQIELRGVDGSPMAEWIDRTLGRLTGCWRTNLP
ncbi:MAG: hypothetical protein V4514_18685 [Pseudomonadota bacterium]|uniref:hypothetical protein n=1 Tax=unclassified Phenylobacterium TaxID=2640670 RepID=UPI0006FBE641|nr:MULTISPECIES: hypothetical protein [unclassified Phenylobacterium]KRB48616.1 hypothetical protein ASE02_18495 [Phenylobacterium sp. Root700]MBT9473540.1 hypothetical protein [Phenylobacterium sp.]